MGSTIIQKAARKPWDKPWYRPDLRGGRVTSRVRWLVRDGVPVQQPQKLGPAKGTYQRVVVTNAPG